MEQDQATPSVKTSCAPTPSSGLETSPAPKGRLRHPRPRARSSRYPQGRRDELRDQTGAEYEAEGEEDVLDKHG